MDNNYEHFHVDLYCRVSDRGTLELLSFTTDPEFRSGDIAHMIHTAANRSLVATLIGLGTEGMILFGPRNGIQTLPASCYRQRWSSSLVRTVRPRYS